MQARIRTAVVGGGRIGTIHVNNIVRSNRMVLSAFVDINEARAKEIQEQTNCQIFTTIQELFEKAKDSFDAIVICSPTKTHVEFTKLAIEHKKPVLCEKPISMVPQEIKDLYDFAAQHNVPVLCGIYEFIFKKKKKIKKNWKIKNKKDITEDMMYHSKHCTTSL